MSDASISYMQVGAWAAAIIGGLVVLHTSIFGILFMVLRAKLDERYMTKAEFAAYLINHDRWSEQVIERLEDRIKVAERSHDAVASELSQIRMLLLQSLKDSDHGSGIR